MLLQLFTRSASPRRVFHAPGAPEPATRLVAADFGAMADALQVEHWIPRALAEIESRARPLTDAGNPVVRLEAPYWKRYRTDTPAARYFDKRSNSRDLDERWMQFVQMASIDRDAAIRAHSFGAFQIMGFNHEYCGFAVPESFLDAMMSVQGQKRAFVTFCLSSPQLLAAMRTGNLQQIAHHYNGPRYARNNYDIKLASWRDDYRSAQRVAV